MGGEEDEGDRLLNDIYLDPESLEPSSSEGRTDAPSESEFWYPSVSDIVALHDSVIEEDEESEPGVRDPDRIEFPITYIEEGHFGEVPETIHGKAFHLMRLLASNHYFVDGNKRTALNTTSMFYFLNGYDFESGKDMRALLKLFSVREDIVDREVGVEYFSDRVRPLEEDDIEEKEWQELLLLLVRGVETLGSPEWLHSPKDEFNVESDADDEGKR